MEIKSETKRILLGIQKWCPSVQRIECIYKENNKSQRVYGTLEEMATDNWYADIDYVPAELNNVV